VVKFWKKGEVSSFKKLDVVLSKSSLSPFIIKQLQKLDKSIAKLILDGIEEFASNPVLTKN